MVALVMLGIGSYAIIETNAHSSGITGLTQKNSSAGCSCHCSSANSATTVTLSDSLGTGTLTTAPNTTITFTATVSNSSESDGGIDIASYSGTGLTAGSGLYASSGELTHSSPKAFSGGSCSWTFTYTTGSSAGWDTLYATGNAVNGDGLNNGGTCVDKWNWSNKFVIHVVSPSKRMALGRSSITLGTVRVGRRVADSTLVTSNGAAAITISSSAMKSGAPFSSYPTGTNRSLNPGTTEMDSVIFTPTARGTFTDSLIYTTNSDTVPQQHMGIRVSGQGVQAVFGTPYGTTLAFGSLRANRTAQQTFTLTNTGDDTLFLQTPSVTGAGFSMVSGPSSLNILPNASGNVVVQFSPTARQSYSGSITFSAANGVSTPTVSLSGAGTLPQLQIASTATLGVTRVNQTLPGVVNFKNNGNDTLHLSNVSLTQASTRFTLGAYDQVVLPGASGIFHISYLPTAEKTDTATLHFISDDPADSIVSVALSASGVLPHMVVDKNHDTVSVGQIKLNATGSAIITVTNNGGIDLNLSNVSAGPAPFTLANRPTIVSAGTSSDITVNFTPTSTGNFFGTLIISGDDAANPSDTVFLVGTGINSALSINPSSVDFGAVPVNTTKYDTIVLSNTGTAAVNITKYTLTNSGTAFAVVDSSAKQVAAGGTANVIVSFHPGTATTFSGSLTLTTDDGTTPTRSITLTGRGVTGALTVTPVTVDFGTVKVSSDSLIHMGLKNSGQAALTISSVAIRGANANEFTTGTFATPKTLNAGDSSTIDVTFQPTVGGNAGAMLDFTLADNSAITIPLQGNGQTSQGAVNDATPFEFSITLTPNPAHGPVTAHVSLARASDATVEIYDAAGHQVWHESLGALSEGAHDVSLGTDDLANGSYFVRIMDSNGNAASTRLNITR